MNMTLANNSHPDSCPALVLNADYQPLSYYPLSLWSWQDAIKAVYLDRVNIVSWPAFTRFNVFLRDKFMCQYCGSKEDLTFDHFVPRSKGGLTTWNNVITACSSCNLKKSNKLHQDIKMHPIQLPFKPNVHELHRNGKSFPPNYLHESWMDFLYWDTELEN